MCQERANELVKVYKDGTGHAFHFVTIAQHFLQKLKRILDLVVGRSLLKTIYNSYKIIALLGHVYTIPFLCESSMEMKTA